MDVCPQIEAERIQRNTRGVVFWILESRETPNTDYFLSFQKKKKKKSSLTVREITL